MALRKTESTFWREKRAAILERDNHRCTNCMRPEGAVDVFNVDHAVPRCRGGSDRFDNLTTLCKSCHEAKHGEGYPPMLEFDSSGRMDKYTFRYWRHFFQEMLPAMGRKLGVDLNPKFRLDDVCDFWFMSLGNMHHLDAQLATLDEEYAALQMAQYW